MTAQEYADTREDVVLWFVSQGHRSGCTIPLTLDTCLPFDLSEVEGEVTEDDRFEATNLTDGSGAYGWRFHDWNSNTVTRLVLYRDSSQHNQSE